MAARGTKVGDVVEVRPHGTKPPVAGTIVDIDGQNLRCVATSDGFVYAAPDEMDRSDEADRTMAVESLGEGDVVVLFNGAERTVESVVATGTPPRYRVTFVETTKALGIFRQQTVVPGHRYFVARHQ